MTKMLVFRSTEFSSVSLSLIFCKVFAISMLFLRCFKERFWYLSVHKLSFCTPTDCVQMELVAVVIFKLQAITRACHLLDFGVELGEPCHECRATSVCTRVVSHFTGWFFAGCKQLAEMGPDCLCRLTARWLAAAQLSIRKGKCVRGESTQNDRVLHTSVYSF